MISEEQLKKFEEAVVIIKKLCSILNCREDQLLNKIKSMVMENEELKKTLTFS